MENFHNIVEEQVAVTYTEFGNIQENFVRADLNVNYCLPQSITHRHHLPIWREAEAIKKTYWEHSFTVKCFLNFLSN